METTNIQPTNEHDEKHAANQLAFAKDVYAHLEKLLHPKSHFNTKAEVGVAMTKLPLKYFGKDEIPSIKGDRSKVFAMLLASHYREFSSIEFDPSDIRMSINVSRIPLLNIRSLPEQIAHQIKLAEKIEKLVMEYDQPTVTAIKKA